MPDTMDYNVRPERIPQDLDAEALLGYYSPGTFTVKFCGQHKRNSYRDILHIEQNQDKLLFSLSRNSIYNSLPEYIFHSIDRFDNLHQHEKKEKFVEEYAKQEEEKDKAYRYFAPIDTLLLQIRLKVQKALEKYIETNTIMQNIILDGLAKEKKNNRFIKKTIPYITSCKTIRGNRTLMTLMLRKIFMDEGISMSIKREPMDFTDEQPKYNDSEGAPIGSVYAGNSFLESTLTYTIAYWSDEECNSEFLQFLQDVDVYRQFVQDYFMSVDSLLVFNITKDAEPLIISDTTTYNYLNYNANI